jgi:hypothetical protein
VHLGGRLRRRDLYRVIRGREGAGGPARGALEGGALLAGQGESGGEQRHSVAAWGLPGAAAAVSLPVGYHTISAKYSGDSQYAASYPASMAETIAACATTTRVLFVGSPNPSSQSLSLEVKVNNTGSTAPTGRVQYLDYGRPLGSRIALGTARRARAR